MTAPPEATPQAYLKDCDLCNRDITWPHAHAMKPEATPQTEKCATCGRFDSDAIHDFAVEGHHNFVFAPPAPSPDKQPDGCVKCGDPEDVGHEFGFRDHAFVCPRCGEKDEHADNCTAPPATIPRTRDATAPDVRPVPSSAGESVTFREHAIGAAMREPELLAEIERLKKWAGYSAANVEAHPRFNAEKARADAAFLRGASWAYVELTGAIIVPASFEEKARAESKEP